MTEATVSGELHDISVAIGRVQAALESGQRSQEYLRQEIHAAVGKIDAVTAQLVEVTAQIGTLAERLDRVEPLVEEWSETRQRAVGFLAGVTLLAGSAGAAATEILKKVFP
jgi:hypothetical protein